MSICVYEKFKNADLLRGSSVCHKIVNALRADVLPRWFFITPFNIFSYSTSYFLECPINIYDKEKKEKGEGGRIGVVVGKFMAGKHQWRFIQKLLYFDELEFKSANEVST